MIDQKKKNILIVLTVYRNGKFEDFINETLTGGLDFKSIDIYVETLMEIADKYG